MTASSALATLVVEVGMMKLTCYLLDITAASWLDTLAYISYTLVG
jgi:hypothetical protein